jgi:hypothetical protein
MRLNALMLAAIVPPVAMLAGVAGSAPVNHEETLRLLDTTAGNSSACGPTSRSRPSAA